LGGLRDIEKKEKRNEKLLCKDNGRTLKGENWTLRGSFAEGELGGGEDLLGRESCFVVKTMSAYQRALHFGKNVDVKGKKGQEKKNS